MGKIPELNFPKIIKEIDFGSGTRNTPEFKGFMRKVNGDFRKLKNSGIITDYKVKTGHFYFTVFFTANDKPKTIYCMSISDVRYFTPENVLIRTAKDYKDYTRGRNDYISLDDNFSENLIVYMLMNCKKSV